MSGPVAQGAVETGKAVSDAAITASIKTDFLKDPDLSVLKIDVDTGGVVTLNGLAGDDAPRARAEKMASAIKGVREVRNFLVVKGSLNIALCGGAPVLRLTSCGRALRRLASPGTPAFTFAPAFRSLVALGESVSASTSYAREAVADISVTSWRLAQHPRA